MYLNFIKSKTNFNIQYKDIKAMPTVTGFDPDWVKSDDNLPPMQVSEGSAILFTCMRIFLCRLMIVKLILLQISSSAKCISMAEIQGSDLKLQKYTLDYYLTCEHTLTIYFVHCGITAFVFASIM